MYSIGIVQLSSKSYFWVLSYKKMRIARSVLIDDRAKVMEEAEKVAKDLQIKDIWILERK